MANLSMSNIGDALKTVYLQGFKEQTNLETNAFYAQIEKTSKYISAGDNLIKVPLRYGTVGGVGMIADDGTLPTPNPRKTVQATLTTKNATGRFSITDKIMKVSRSNVAAFADMLEKSMDDTKNAVTLDQGRQLLGDGTGKLATINAVDQTDATLLTLDTETQAAGEMGTLYLQEGMLVDVYTTTTKDTAAAEVLLVDEANSKVKLSSATGAADNDVIYRAGNKDMELSGLRHVFEATTVYGLAKADYPWLTPDRLNLSGAEIADSTIQARIDAIRRRTGAKTDFIMVSPGVHRAYINYLAATKSIVNTLELKGGWSAISYTSGSKTVPITVDDLLPAGKMYGLVMEDWVFNQISDWDWLDADGAILSRMANKATYEGTLIKYADLACLRPRAQWEIYGIAEHN